MGWLDRLLGRDRVSMEPVRTAAQFQTIVLDSPLPVIVDVWSQSCAPCRRLVPVLEGVAARYRERVRVVEISTEADPALLSRLRVRATPTLILFEDGEELGRTTGFRPPNWFHEMIAAEFPEVAPPGEE